MSKTEQQDEREQREKNDDLASDLAAHLEELEHKFTTELNAERNKRREVETEFKEFVRQYRVEMFGSMDSEKDGLAIRLGNTERKLNRVTDGGKLERMLAVLSPEEIDSMRMRLRDFEGFDPTELQKAIALLQDNSVKDLQSKVDAYDKFVAETEDRQRWSTRQIGGIIIGLITTAITGMIAWASTGGTPS